MEIPVLSEIFAISLNKQASLLTALLASVDRCEQSPTVASQLVGAHCSRHPLDVDLVSHLYGNKGMPLRSYIVYTFVDPKYCRFRQVASVS